MQVRYEFRSCNFVCIQVQYPLDILSNGIDRIVALITESGKRIGQDPSTMLLSNLSCPIVTPGVYDIDVVAPIEGFQTSRQILLFVVR